MRILMSGASGLVGTALSTELTRRGHVVTRLIRKTAHHPGEVKWNPKVPPVAEVAQADVIVNLSGAGIGDHRWTATYRQEIMSSRVETTSSLAKAIVAAGNKPYFVSMSAVGYYGNRTTKPHVESDEPGDTFLAKVCVAWEQAADPARAAGATVCHPRLSMVLANRGGALEKLRMLYRLGLGGPLGNGRQHWPWISLTDTVNALIFLIENPQSGPVNLVSPEVSTNRDFNRALAAAVQRPAVIPVPGLALKLVLGGFGEELLADQPVLPSRLKELGFAWQDPNLAATLKKLSA